MARYSPYKVSLAFWTEHYIGYMTHFKTGHKMDKITTPNMPPIGKKNIEMNPELGCVRVTLEIKRDENIPQRMNVSCCAAQMCRSFKGSSKGKKIRGPGKPPYLNIDYVYSHLLSTPLQHTMQRRKR